MLVDKNTPEALKLQKYTISDSKILSFLAFSFFLIFLSFFSLFFTFQKPPFPYGRIPSARAPRPNQKNRPNRPLNIRPRRVPTWTINPIRPNNSQFLLNLPTINVQQHKIDRIRRRPLKRIQNPSRTHQKPDRRPKTVDRTNSSSTGLVCCHTPVLTAHFFVLKLCCVKLSSEKLSTEASYTSIYSVF